MKENKGSKKIIVLTIIAAAFSGYLLYHHVLVNGGYQTQPSPCSINKAFDCDAVAKSSHSEWFGIPVASFSLLYYLLFMFTTLFISRSSSLDRKAFWSVTNVFASFGFVVSIYMFAVSLVSLGTVCLFCSIIYFCSLLLCLISYLNVRKEPGFFLSLKAGYSKIFEFFLSIFAGPYSKSARKALLGILPLIAIVYFTPDVLKHTVFKEVTEKREEAKRKYLDYIKRQINSESNRFAKGNVVFEDDFIAGSADAIITIVEYVDYECPACRKAHFELKEILEEYSGAVQLVVKSFPFDAACNPLMTKSHHKNACAAAVAARCVGEQDKQSFWEIHNDIFSQASLDQDTIRELAVARVGDLTKYNQCVSSDRVTQRLARDIKLAESLRLQSTPTVYLLYNSKIIFGASPFLLRDTLDLILGEG